ncbi:ribonuclease HI [Sulfurospirillum multivorans]|uniref:Ribonuclease H n=2 Tax=Sulfurospirillum multivorans TaxID=66821 RepID=A0AA86E3M1_SULMK|nr:ribonuclease HI [Sulfurospirillum multivorans]AHJ13962.1 ribonuclease H [Sulfurospirillum multivorans DSM 12446]QEH07450.1 ribonuclease H [Sulfurospirillum multivorans]
MKKISLFCDGSSLGNPGSGGYCAILRFGSTERIVSGGMANATNNQMELLAVIEGLAALKEPCDVTLISDSSYVIKGINEWLDGWKRKNFAKVKNPEMWQRYLDVSKIHKVHGIWVRGHDGHAENEMCDKIAKEEATKIKLMES